MSIKSVKELDFGSLVERDFHPSPSAWEDQVLYFLMLDRFSDGRERGYQDNDGNLVTSGSTRMFSLEDSNFIDRDVWQRSGHGYRGGTLKGLESKVGYLKRLGVTAIWVSPIFKQVAFQQTYHGYGIQNFLDIEPRFGTPEDLRDLVRTAHSHGIYVILDIILNHAGNVFSYNADRYETERDGHKFIEPRWDGKLYDVAGLNDETGRPAIAFGNVPESAFPDGAVWPVELQSLEAFTRKGVINNWDFKPEFLEGDFFDLKNIHLGEGDVDDYKVSEATLVLAEVYKHWIAFADLDGFRIDTVKHMDPGAARFFASVIHEFAQSIGKENFYLIGEITGGRQNAYQTLEITGLDAALGIDEIPEKLEFLVKGFRNPKDYFDLFRHSFEIGKPSHTWFRDKVVTMFDDHDQVSKGSSKARFCANNDGHKVVLNALALNATTLGIPCVYYGTEQQFNGKGPSDLFLREAMFGGEFGGLQTRDRHFFNEASPTYREFSKILAIRRASLPLRRGRQYLRAVSGNGVDFGLPAMMGGEIRWVVPWSRIFNNHEVLAAINTDYQQAISSWVTVDASLHAPGDKMTCIYSTDADDIGRSVEVEARNGAAVFVKVPAAGFVIYE
jgi:glycosidase